MVEQSAGLIESIKRLASTLVAIVSTRLELLANEIQLERLRLMQVVLFAISAIFFLGMGILLLTMYIVVVFWDDHRLAVLGGLCILFLVLGMLMATLSRNKAQSRPGLFSSSITELAKDREQLGPRE
jgi:uncharacterized membrane protein YqjE